MKPIEDFSKLVAGIFVYGFYLVASYVVASFVFGSTNAYSWGIDGRFNTVAVAACVGAFYTLLVEAAEVRTTIGGILLAFMGAENIT